MKNKCNCDLCKRSRKFEKILDTLKKICEDVRIYRKYNIDKMIKKDIKWLKELYKYLVEIESELDIIKNKDGFFVHFDPSDWKGIVGSAENKCQT